MIQKLKFKFLLPLAAYLRSYKFMAYEFISKLNKITSYFLVVPKQISNKSNLCFALCSAMYNIKPSLNNIYKLFKT